MRILVKILFLFVLLSSGIQGALAQCIPGTPPYSCVYMWTSNVTLGSINNSTGCSAGSYGDYYGVYSNSMVQGSSATLSVSCAGYPMNYSVWIDLNNNGSFYDAGENVLTLSNGGVYSLSGTITIPSGTSVGNHRMRVMAEYYGSAFPTDPCGTLTYGETEDYTINVTSLVVPYKSLWVSMNVGSTSWCAGEVRNVTVTVTNNGTSTWTDAGVDVNIGCKWNAEADYYVRRNAGNLVPGGTATYTFTMTAPMTTGSNNLTFDVVKEGDCWFGGNAGSCGPGNVVYTSAPLTIGVLPSTAGLVSPANGATGQCPNMTTSLNWSAASGPPSGYKLYLGTNAAATNIINGTNIGNVLTYNPLPLAPNTTYYWKVVPTNTCGDASGAPIWSFTTSAICYCTPPASVYACTYMYISNVNLGSINNTTGCSASWADYSASQSTTMTQGSSATITLTSVSYVLNYAIWIDYNDNGVFTDAGENVLNIYGGSTVVSGTLNISVSAPSGNHKMRIMGEYTGSAFPSNPCGQLSYGETEDYNINICTAPASPSPATFGSGVWNAYCYSGNSLDLTNCGYAGYYTETALSYDSQNKYSNIGSPSSATGYVGCTLGVDYHTVVYKRQDFTCGKYQLDILSHDDDIRVYVNGSQVFEHVGCCDAHTNIWTGYLSTGSTIEVRHAEGVGGSQQALTITNVTPAIVNGSLTINGVAADAKICTGSTVAIAQGTGGSFPEASYYYWIGSENPVGSGWVTTWAIWNGANQNNPTPANPPVFNTPGRYVVHTNAINNTCGWGYYGTGRTRFVDVIASPAAPTSATASPASVCLGSSSTLTTSGGLGAYYTFNNTLADASGNGLTLTGSGGTLSAAGIQLSTGSTYTSPYTEILNSDKYTLDFYMQYTTSFDGTWRKIFGFTPSGTDRSPGIWRYPSSMQMHWRHDPGNTGLTESKVYTQGQWYHIVGEKNGGTFAIYIDNVLVDQGAVANPKTNGQAVLWFGGANVLLKEFKIYNGIFRWYSGSCGGTLEGSGPTIIVNPPATTTYYVREEGDCGNSSCTSTTVTVIPTTGTFGGADQYICSSLTSATMAASGSGTWTQVSGAAATITTPSSATTTVTGLSTGTYVFRWTVGCSYDDVVIVKQ